MWRRVALAGLLTAVVAMAQASFDKKLTGDRKLQHALNRLTFGARPGDLEAVRRLGLEKWIQAQLHPETLTENAELDVKLKPLETLRLDMASLVKDYPLTAIKFTPRPSPFEIIGNDGFQKLTRGTLEERLAVLKPLDAAKRRQVLASVSLLDLASMPDLKKEAEDARAAEQKDRQDEIRRAMPPLSDLLEPSQMATAMRGKPEDLKELFASMDEKKRAQVAAMLPPNATAEFPEYRRAGMKLRQPQQVLVDDLKEAKVLRAIYSNRQLEEELVDFWTNHFNIYESKQNVRPFLSTFERDAIRPHVLGKFKDLLLATARHPAMLYYLDNWESMSPEIFSVGPFAPPMGALVQNFARQAHGLNENYGREVMELHTLGVKGGYTQDDVIAVARCFTGWTVRDPSTDPHFAFAAFMHDTAEKTVLGHKIAAGGGEQDGLQVIDILAHHPSTAKFISRELAVRFVADNPPDALVNRMAQTFLKTDGDLRAVMETMLASPEFFSQGAFEAKIKSPFEMVVSAVRAMGGETADGSMLVQKTADLGQPLYGRIDPAGYPNTAETWLNTAGLFARIRFASALTAGEIPGVKIDVARLDGKDAAAVSHLLLGADANPQTEAAMEQKVAGKDLSPRFVAGLVLASPDFQRR